MYNIHCMYIACIWFSECILEAMKVRTDITHTNMTIR